MIYISFTHYLILIFYQEIYDEFSQRNYSHECLLQKIDYGIIIHYIKDSCKVGRSGMKCRKAEYRSRLKDEADKLIKFMNMDKPEFSKKQNKEAGNRDEQKGNRVLPIFEHKVKPSIIYVDKVIGIDAANFELNCRPDNFGVIFRKQRYEILDKHELFITFHVGEEFLNLSNGLRAIDEAIDFLGMKRNDRLGHAIALGINVDDYISTKKNTLISNLQDWVDDLCWMYFSLIDTKEVDFNILEQIKNDFKTNEMQLYCMTKIHPPDIYDYFNSMLLRGDDPELYPDYWGVDYDDAKYKNECKKVSFRMNTGHVRHRECFMNKIARDHYYYYHYNEKMKENGEKILSFKIPHYYSCALRQIQKLLKHKVSNLGLAVEVNPTSNKKISMLKQYHHLHLFQLNSFGLSEKSAGSNDKCNVAVTICTDDSAIFQTSLSNEYAMIASSMIKSGYLEEEVYQYIDYLGKLSNQLSFV